jgi:hypothetical protein
VNVTARKVGHYTYVIVDNRFVAIMKRSEFTGEFCYGLRNEPSDRYPYPTFRPPFQQTYRKSPRAAAKVAVAAYQEKEGAS